ncbi:Uncharacterised protein [Mycobacteroides abscessus subsp. massiliense]|nr:Uncharacterised protein [Mycobacteroides abscessus subsp. massiliense]
MGRIAKAPNASISSAMRIEPSWAVNRQPACTANASEAINGASSRVFTSDEMKPVAGPSPSRSLDGDQGAGKHPQPHRHAGGTAANHDGSVSPRDIGEQAHEFSAVVA